MTLQRYRHVIAVAEAGGFGAAAERLGIKQPPLSQSVARLERELGVPLFVRTSRGATLTCSGEAFLTEARRAVDAADRATMAAKRASDASAPFRVGVVSLALFEILPDILTSASDTGVPVEVVYASTDAQLTMLARGALDLAVVSPPFTLPDGAKLAALPDQEMVVAAPSTLTATLDLAELCARLMLFRREAGPFLHDAITHFFGHRGLKPPLVEEAPADLLATLAMVAAGRGVSFVPDVVARHVQMAGVVYRPLPTPGFPSWPLAFVHMRLQAHSSVTKVLHRLRERGYQLDSKVSAGERPLEQASDT